MEPTKNDEYRFNVQSKFTSSESDQSELSKHVEKNNAEKKTSTKTRNYSDAVRHGSNVTNHRRGKNSVSGGKNEKTRDIKNKPFKEKEHSKKKERLEENVHTNKNKTSTKKQENQTHLQKKKFRKIDYTYLQELCLLDGSESVLVLLDKKCGFLNLFEQNLRPDWVILIMEILKKVCLSDLNFLKVPVLSSACHYMFLDNLQKYISKVPTDNDKKRQSSTSNFFHNTFIFCDTVNNIIPNTAKERLLNVFQTVDIVLKFIREHKSKTECHFMQDDSLVEIINSFSQLQSRTLSVLGNNADKQNVNEDSTDMLQECPPSDFRNIDILPSHEDMFSIKPFLRKNIVKGSYGNILNYLDIHFRLFREDFIAPLRDGIREYLDRLANPGKKIRMKSVKTYVNVSFQKMVSHQNGFGFEVHFSVENRRGINWEHSKQLKCSSLLLISDDEFNTFFTVTVLDRKMELLRQGIITVTLPYGAKIPENIFENHYVMLESVVYFEPYFRVLTALKKVKEENFPMEKYIICVEPDKAIPKYLKDPHKDKQNKDEDNNSDLLNSLFKNDLGSIEKLNSPEETEKIAKNDCPPTRWKINNFEVSDILDEECWPSYSDLKLDPSQYSAFKAALTSEFCVIQGPPGTGKTFIALKIAEVLLKNVKFQSNPIMIICYTNHALDQFLEGILSFTNSLIRIGSQSKNTNLDKYNIKEVRKIVSNRYSYSRSIKNQLKEISEKIIALEKQYKSLNYCGILEMGILKNFMAAKEQKKLIGGVLAEWLLEDILMGESIHYSCSDRSHGLLDIHQPEIKENIEESEKLDAENVEEEWELNEENALRQQETEIDPLNVQFKINLEQNTFWKNQFIDFEFNEKFENIDWNLNRLNKIYDELYSKKTHCTRELDYLQMKINLLTNFKLKEMDKMNLVKSYLKERLSTTPPFSQDILKEFIESDNIWCLDTSKRWALYHYWKTLYGKVIMNDIKILEKEHREKCFELEEYRQIEDIDFVKTAKVIGMTTTSSARLHSMLERLKPKIVIVEEAAEVFEAHIVTALTKHCEHLILIGDHKQLRPNPNTFKLAKDYHLDISLFERMLKNGMSCHTLGVQHRMRPEFASLLVPMIYPELENHPSVEGRTDIRGVGSNLYFINHSIPEDQVEDSSSRSNKHEADFIISLCCYLIYQGYKPQEITILSPYIGQMYYLFKRRREKPLMKDVRITVIDNFQGEENKIILLSLVRSNADARIGFLGTDNRICVSLSRAKDGFYIIGNMDNLTQNSNTWKEINRQLDEFNVIGPALPLRCENHKHHITRVSCEKDFLQVLYGCCPLNCGVIMDCGHVCTKMCHLTDKEHKKTKCLEFCIRENCEFSEHNYKCKKLCWEECVLCEIIVKRNLPCGHEIDLPCHRSIEDFKCKKVVKKRLVCGHDYEMYCHEDPTPSIECKELTDRILKCGHVKTLQCYIDSTKYKCKELVERELPCGHSGAMKCCEDTLEFKCKIIVKYTIPLCKHEVDKLCYLKEVEICPHPCIDRLDCGHVCNLTCHKDRDPDHLQYKCTKKCAAQKKKNCSMNHECKKLCHYNQDCDECMLTVVKKLPCGHETNVLCSTDVNDVFCKVPCVKILQCSHTVNVKCSTDVSKWKCLERCEKTLPCGHETNMLCCVDVNEVLCSLPCVKTLKCSHTVNVQCSTDVDKFKCQERCQKMLPCGHEKSVPCWVDVNKVFCRVPCVKTMKCSHTVNIECSTDIDKLECQERSEKMLPCGHEKSVRCYVDVNKVLCSIPSVKILKCLHTVHVKCSTDVSKWKCLERCEKTLPCGHETNVLCSVDVNEVLCSLPCVKILKCSHTVNVLCSTDVNDMKCQEICEETLPCGHQATLKCSANTFDIRCKETVEKQLPTCDHTQQGLCYQDPTPCKEPCSRLLKCGHRCLKRCGDICSIKDCQEVVNDRILLTDCGHSNTASPCFIFQQYFEDNNKEGLLQNIMSSRNTDIVSWVPKTKVTSYCLQRFCQELCNKKLPCGHMCTGLCGDCIQGNIHVPCKEKCNKKLICGHICVAMCKEICPPCNQSCLNSCQHRQCSRQCGETCDSCMEKCDWKCPHKSCTRLCSQMCNRNPCYEPCPKELKCGHPCMGFCGEVCPPCCPICDGLNFLYEKNERLVQLEDCGHIVDSKKLDMLIHETIEDGQISLKVCPTCETPINKTKRCRNVARVTNRKIQAVKSQVLYEFRSMFTKIDFLKSKLHSNHHHEIFEVLVDHVDKKLKESNRAESPHNYYAVVMITEWLIELTYLKHRTRIGFLSGLESKKLIESRAESLSKSMQMYLNSLNYEVMNRFDLEVLRIKRMMSLLNLNMSFKHLMNQKAFNLLFSNNDYTDVIDEEICRKLNVYDKCLKSVPSSNKNINLSENVWFQCTSDHVYSETRSSGRICTRCNNVKKREETNRERNDHYNGKRENEGFPYRRNEKFRKLATGLASNAQTSSIHNLEKELYQQLRSIPGYEKNSLPGHDGLAPSHRGHSESGNGLYSASDLRRNSAPGYKGTYIPEYERREGRGKSTLVRGRNSVPQHRNNFSSENERNWAQRRRENSTPGHGINSIPRHRNKKQEDKYPAACDPQNKIPSLLHMKLVKPPSQQVASSSSKLTDSANPHSSYKKKKRKHK